MTKLVLLAFAAIALCSVALATNSDPLYGDECQGTDMGEGCCCCNQVSLSTGAQRQAPRLCPFHPPATCCEQSCWIWNSNRQASGWQFSAWSTCGVVVAPPPPPPVVRQELSGVVVSATTTSPIAGASLSCEGNGQVVSAVASGSGSYSVQLPAGSWRLTASSEGYITHTADVVIESSASTRQIVLSPVAPPTAQEHRFVLRWGAGPNDLDSHLVASDGCRVHWSQRTCSRGAVSYSLDVDDTDGFGPETTTITGTLPCGKYSFYVHHWSYGTWSSADIASVDVYGDNAQVATRQSPRDDNGFVNGVWHVADITVNAQGVATYTYPNNFIPYNGNWRDIVPLPVSPCPGSLVQIDEVTPMSEEEINRLKGSRVALIQKNDANSKLLRLKKEISQQ